MHNESLREYPSLKGEQTYRQVFQRWWHHQLGGGHTWGPSDWRVWQGEVGGAVLGSCTTWSQDWHAGMLPCTAWLVLCRMSSAGLGGRPTTHPGSSSPDGSLSEGISLVPATVFWVSQMFMRTVFALMYKLFLTIHHTHPDIRQYKWWHRQGNTTSI